MIHNYIKKIFSKIKSLFRRDKRFYYLSLIEEDIYPNNYCIHGLWPQYNKKEYPKYCKEVSFDVELLNDIRDELELYWKPKNISIPEKFWEHEWKKHGSCVFTDINQYDYFYITLQMYKKVINNQVKIKKKYKNGNNVLVPFKLKDL